MRQSRILLAAVSIFVAAAATPLVRAGAHTWDVNELFSSADGTIQFIELLEMNGTPNETNVATHTITSTSNMFVIPTNVAAPTSNRTILFATAAFAALPGAPVPDHIISENFFSIDGDTIRYTPYDTFVFGAGALPTDGLNSLDQNFAIGTNSPKNYAGTTGSVDARSAPPAVAATGSTPLLVSRDDTTGSAMTLTFDTTTCGNTEHQILYGLGAQLPSAPGEAFAMQGGVCAMGGSPYSWVGVPDSSIDAKLLLWFVVVATNGSTTEGSWGLDGRGAERLGPGAGGSSGQCAMTTKDLSNTCGQ